MNKLTLSSSGGSGQSVSLFIDCARKFQLRYHNGYRSKIIPQSLWYGSVIHDALLIKHLKQQCSREEVVDFLRGEILYKAAYIKRDNAELECKDEPQVLLDKAIAIFDKFAEHKVLPILIEEKISVPLTDPSTGEKDASVAVCGRMDLVQSLIMKSDFSDNNLTISRNDGGVSNASTVIVDLKTSSAKISSTNSHLFQLIFYCYLWYVEHKKIPDYVGIINVTKTKIPTLQEIFYRPSMVEVQSIYEMLVDAVAKIRARKFPQNFLSCRGRYHTDCEYLPICHTELFEIPEIEIERTLICD